MILYSSVDLKDPGLYLVWQSQRSCTTCMNTLDRSKRSEKSLRLSISQPSVALLTRASAYFKTGHTVCCLAFSPPRNDRMGDGGFQGCQELWLALEIHFERKRERKRLVISWIQWRNWHDRQVRETASLLCISSTMATVDPPQICASCEYEILGWGRGTKDSPNISSSCQGACKA